MSQPSYYHGVRVLRTECHIGPQIIAEHKIRNKEPWEDYRWFYVPDFIGTQEDAQIAAQRVGKRLKGGVNKYEARG